VQFNGHDVQLWVGTATADAARPVVVYWHGTGSAASEAESMLSPVFDKILAQGGIIASLSDTTEEGDITSTGTWYTGDFAIVDELIGCLGAHANIDAQRIYTAGCDSGGIQAGALAYARSNYIAAAMLNSGGQVAPFALQDPRRAPALITAHGEQGRDVVIVDFADISEALTKDLVSKGGFAVDCNHHGTHCGASPELIEAQWEFLQAHPYGVAPEPYSAGLPDGFPSYCEIVE
jgi:poly(3-hydroxybutyrate) depolymerase